MSLGKCGIPLPDACSDLLSSPPVSTWSLSNMFSILKPGRGRGASFQDTNLIVCNPSKKHPMVFHYGLQALWSGSCLSFSSSHTEFLLFVCWSWLLPVHRANR